MNLSKRNMGVAASLMMLAIFSIFQVSAQSSTSETLLIGFIGASEGRQAEVDRQLYQAAVLAAEQITAGDDDDDEGIDGPNDTRYDLSVVYYEADTVDEVVEALADAVNDGVIAVLGPHDQELLDALSDAGTPDVAVISGLPDAPDGSGFFRTAADYEAWANAAADYLVNERNYTRIAVVTSDTSAATTAAELFDQAITQDVIVANLTNEADEENFIDDARTIRDAKAQVIFAWTLDAQMIALLEALDSVGWGGEIVYAGLDDGFLQTAGADLALGIFGLTGWSAAAYDATSQSFAADYQARWETTAPDASAAYYDSVYLLANAISKAGESASAIATQLANATGIQGVQGQYDRGQIEALMLVQVMAAGQLVEAARYAAGVCITCLDTWWVDTSDETATQTETFNIGLITTTSGPAKENGENIEQAARLALREINEAGGVLRNGTRYTLNLRVYTAVSSSEASTTFQAALDDGMQIIIGPDYNAHILSNLTAASNAGLVQLVSATSAQIAATEADDAVLQMRATDETLVTSAAEYLLNTLDLTRFAFVAVRTDYGLDAADDFAQFIDASDEGELVLRLEHDLDETDYEVLAQRIVDANVEAVAVWSNQPAASALLVALDELDWQGVFVYGYLTPEFAEQITDMSVDVIAPVNWWAANHDWASQNFSTRYTARYNAMPIPQSASYYDAIYLIATALAESGTTASSLQTWFTSLDSFTGVQGEYAPGTYDTGELTRSVTMVGVSAEGIYEIARYDGTTCRSGCTK
ncbi:MAG: ABC transporter substrate-binding protein [Anaerolineae bacterium]|nr:ABC transporter substrate-binding protein [Anaerolineae bacterium]